MVGIAPICLAALASAQASGVSPHPGEAGGAGLAIRCAKALVCPLDPSQVQVMDNVRILIRDGLIEAIGPARDITVPRGFDSIDVGQGWVMPGMIDLHSHIGGGGINDGVYQTNPGLSVRPTVVPGNARLRLALSAGVSTILFIPGSATNMGGIGLLLRTAPERYEEMVLLDPGSLKIAQADNPKRWGYGMARIMLNWQIRDTVRRGLAYARRWQAFEEREGPRPERMVHLDIFRALLAGTPISVHTQVHQVVLSTLRILVEEAGLNTFIDHGTFDGYLAAAKAEELGVPAILGPRSVSWKNRGRGIDHDGRFMGVAAEYQRRGHSMIGFNTDAPVVPQEELVVQAAMGARYGFDDSEAGTVRGVTIIPAKVVGIAESRGSIEVGKEADLVVVDGHPADPRNAVRLVFVGGRRVVDAEEERLW